jgi:hypothetical protein
MNKASNHWNLSNIDFILINFIYSENDFLISDKKQAKKQAKNQCNMSVKFFKWEIYFFIKMFVIRY